MEIKMYAIKLIELILDKWLSRMENDPFNGGASGIISGCFEKFISCAMPISPINPNNIDFSRKPGDETFSEMLLRLVNESGEKPSAIYNRANIERRHYSKIINHKNYQPSKQTALAFAIALKLDYEKTQKFLATAGYTIGKSLLSDKIISCFIEYKIYNVNLINELFYKYNIPLLGG